MAGYQKGKLVAWLDVQFDTQQVLSEWSLSTKSIALVTYNRTTKLTNQGK